MVGAGGVGCELFKTLALWLSRYSHCKFLLLLSCLCIVVSFYFFLAFCCWSLVLVVSAVSVSEVSVSFFLVAYFFCKYVFT